MASGKITTFEKPPPVEGAAIPEDLTFMPKKKMVMMGRQMSSQGVHSGLRLSYNEVVDMELQRAIDLRDHLHMNEVIDGQLVDVTPKPIAVAFDTDGYKKLKMKANAIPKMSGDSEAFRGATSSVMRARSSRGVGVRLSMEDVIAGIGSERMLTEDLRSTTTTLSPYIEESSSSITSVDEMFTPYKLPFIRVVLRKTELMLLFEQHSMTAIKNTEDGNYAEYDNKQYDYLTIGRGKVRRRSEAETQTQDTLFKSRKINTIRKEFTDRGSYVSYFEMFDTYKLLEKMGPSYWADSAKERQLQTVPHRLTAEEQVEFIVSLPAFHWASTAMKRFLAGNNYENSMRRYRNMIEVKRTVAKINYKYSMPNLFLLNPYGPDNERRAVSDMSFCYKNNDILAVSYGIYSYQAAKLPTTGAVCIWTIKNSSDPERYYFYNYPVVSVEFSPYMPTLLAVGLFDGSVEVRDITNYNQPPIAISQRTTSPGVDPVTAIKWIKQPDGNDNAEIDPFLALSQDGSVTRFRIINSPFLLGVKQMVLERIEGKPEGLQIKPMSDQQQQANPHPQGLNLTKHPLYPYIYYILTDEGCVHKCSTNYQQHYLEVFKTHEGSVNSMDFSPWSPKLFLTCGNDWRIRIWLEGIFKPLVTLQSGYGPYQWAAWSRTHSTILMALNRKQCEIWDLRRSTLRPVSAHTMASSYNTLALFSRDGNSIAIGNERGKVFLNALDEMPFPPHYQYDSLEKTIFAAVVNYPELMNELKSVGYFGYPNKAFVMPP